MTFEFPVITQLLILKSRNHNSTSCYIFARDMSGFWKIRGGRKIPEKSEGIFLSPVVSRVRVHVDTRRFGQWAMFAYHGGT